MFRSFALIVVATAISTAALLYPANNAHDGFPYITQAESVVAASTKSPSFMERAADKINKDIGKECVDEPPLPSPCPEVASIKNIAASVGQPSSPIEAVNPETNSVSSNAPTSPIEQHASAAPANHHDATGNMVAGEQDNFHIPPGFQRVESFDEVLDRIVNEPADERHIDPGPKRERRRRH